MALQAIKRLYQTIDISHLLINCFERNMYMYIYYTLGWMGFDLPICSGPCAIVLFTLTYQTVLKIIDHTLVNNQLPIL